MVNKRGEEESKRNRQKENCCKKWNVRLFEVLAARKALVGIATRSIEWRASLDSHVFM